jgi:hypothetical protein
MIRERRLGLGGAWFWYGSGSKAQLVGNWKTPGIGPVSVLWDGQADGALLQTFFLGAVNILKPPASTVPSIGSIATTYETLLLTENDEIRLQSLVNPLLPKEFVNLAEFVRFDCALGKTQHDQGMPLSVWGCLEPPPSDASDVIDSIGVYTTRAELVALRSHVSNFAAKTSRSKMSADLVVGFLSEFEQGLAQILENRSYTF